MNRRLEGKVAVITGAAGNIGHATALRFLEEGACVVAVDHNEAGLQAIGSSDNNFLAIAADVTSESDALRVVDQVIERFGKIDVFFANAGVEGVVRNPLDYPIDAYERIMNVNVKGVFIAMKHIAPKMSEVDPISRTPYCSHRRSPRCPIPNRLTRRNFESKWSSWFELAANPASWPKSLAVTPPAS